MRDKITNYATGAFREYAALQMPLFSDLYKEISENGNVDDQVPLLMDVLAVEKTIAHFEEVNPMINEAVKAVYFTLPSQPFTGRVAAGRVRYFSAMHNVSERNIYRWLQTARKVFAQKRGLRP